MSALLGEFRCKLDAKSRVAIPSALLKQMTPEDKERFVINRGYETQLSLYPGPLWDAVASQVDGLDEHDTDARKLSRLFYRGATPLALDAQNRLLLPKPLLQYAAISDSVVLFARARRIEVWATHLYDAEVLDDDPSQYAALAEKVFGNG